MSRVSQWMVLDSTPLVCSADLGMLFDSARILKAAFHYLLVVRKVVPS